MSWIPWVPPDRRPPVDGRVIAAAVVAVLVVVAVLLGGRGQAPAPEAGDEPMPPSGMTTGTIPRLVDLGADKCVPCKMMAPILDEMRATFDGRLDVVFIDVWKDPEAGRRYGVQIIPTQIFFDEDGNELFRHQGFFSRGDILAKWREFGYTFEE